ncbi:protein wntless [Condylostylus longicornis]|uniref:protein wntless n=1 Tax=Condylostylus longicornis TaxID=2530218 RepID=UPI00244E10DF|nr:protein wntless [Condylostylus longicornis]
MGTILENLSGKKLTILVSCLLILQIICFLIGGLIAPIPASHQNVFGLVCRDKVNSFNDTSIWFYSRGIGKCDSVNGPEIENHDTNMKNEIVYVFQMPLPREGQVLDYSRWQQNLIGVLHVDIAFEKQVLFNPHTILTIDARLAYRNKGDADGDWKLLAKSIEHRHLDCDVQHVSQDERSCNVIPLFELGSLHHDYYLLNIRIPTDSGLDWNTKIGHIDDLQLITIYQNGGFTKVWVSLKTIFFPSIIAIMVWFWRRVNILQRAPALLEYMLLYLGIALTFLNMPMEYLTLFFEMPFMLLLSDIRQGIFYAMLLSFWLVFAGEHMLIQESGEKNSLKIYWKHLSAVVVGCISLFIFDMCERGAKLRNPFYSIWTSKFGTNLALCFIVLAGISAAIYFIFLCYMVWKVFCNISVKRTTLPSMSNARRLHYEGIIYRFEFLMLATLLCAALTGVGYILGQFAEGHWKWDDNLELQVTSAFMTGVYGMWNIYIFALIILYAPSHKQWPKDNNLNENIVSEEIEFNNLPSDSNPSEISSLTSFSRKAAFD